MKPREFLIFLTILLSACQPLATGIPTQSTTLQPSPASVTTPTGISSVPQLQVITVANADKVRLLFSLQIPGEKTKTLGQCSVAFSPDGKLVAGACSRNAIPVWETESGRLVRTLQPPPVHDVAITFSPDGRTIAAGGFLEDIRIWDFTTGQLIQTIEGQPAPVWDLAFCPGGDQLVSANLDIKFPAVPTIPGIHLWNLSGDPGWAFHQEGGQPLALSVDCAPDGVTVASGTLDSILVLDAEAGNLIRSIPMPNHVGDIAFSHQGHLLAGGCDDHNIRLWDTNGYELQSSLAGHSHYVNGVAFSPSDELLISGSHDGKVGIWDIEHARLLQLNEGHEAPVLRVAMNPAGTLIASISWDGTVRLWGIME